MVVETLEALENDDEVVGKANTERLGDTRKKKDSVLLKIMATILDEGFMLFCCYLPLLRSNSPA